MINAMNDGESPIPHAPLVPLGQGDYCIPQHYLRYTHSKSSIEKIVAECSFDKNYLFFVGEDETTGLYLQVGIVGYDTYKRGNKKIVYGRKWRVDSQTPTSEIIQTLFLAVKKAREHEIRELLKLQVNGKWSAPFSTHQDLPLIAKHAAQLSLRDEDCSFSAFKQHLTILTKNLTFDGKPIQMVNIEKRRNTQILLDLRLPEQEDIHLSLHTSQILTLILPSACPNVFLHLLMDALIAASDAYVAEHFRFQKVNRFSTGISILALASLSLRTRAAQGNPELAQSLAQLNAQVDQSRVPTVSGSQARKVQTKLYEFGTLDGFYPTLLTD